MLRRLFMVGLAVIGMGFLLSPQVDGATLPRNLIFISGGGAGTYFPEVGSYVSDGAISPLGKSVGTGRVETTQTGPTTLDFQGWGRGTQNEFLDRILVADGTIFARFDPGTVELTPDLTDPNFDPLVGPYTAQWEAVTRVVGGTGRFKNARGIILVTATNEPFLLTDPEWAFSWTWDGIIRTRGRR